jgi:hypothetical protein
VKPDAVVKAEVALGAVARSWQPVSARIGNDRGRWLVRLADGRSVFVKAPFDDASAEWLRIEALVYQGVHADLMPQLLAWDGELLVLENLSDATWPPPWTAEAVAAVRAALEELAQVTPPAGLPALTDVRELLVDTGWPAVQADPEPMLSIGLCSREWLEAALPQCGPAPEELLPQADAAAFAAALAGFWGARAGLAAPPWGPRLRELQRAQTETALAWAVRALDLPAPR